jgi:hypothetical protein
VRLFARASSAGSTEATGKSRGFLRRALPIRGGFSKSAGTGARLGGRLGGILTLLVMAIFSFGLTAAPAGAAPPTVTINPNPIPSYASVQVSGTAAAGNGGSTSFEFEISTDNVNWTSYPRESADASPEISRELGGLKGGTHYFVRLRAINFTNEESTLSAEPNPEFTTLPVVKPTILATDSASEVAYTTAKATGEVERPANPDVAFDTNCSFEYVTDAQFTATGFQGALAAPCEQNPITTPEEQRAVSANLVNLHPSTVYHLRLAASDAGGTEFEEAPSTFNTLAVVKPTILSISDASAITYNSARILANVERPANADPAFNVECSFEYVTEAQFVANGFGAATTIPCVPGSLTTAGPNTVRAELTGLHRGTTYRVRVIASNLGGTETLEANAFTTTTAPQVQTLGAGSVGTDSAILTAQINPSNGPVTYQFEWGRQEGANDETYENRVPLTPEPLPAQDESFHSVAAQLLGLSPATAYHYRIVATNTQTEEVSKGNDRTFTTVAIVGPQACPNESSRVGPSAGLPDCRAYEWATPGLNNTSILASGSPVGVLADGSAIEYITFDAPADALASTINQPVVSQRGASGWQTHSIGALSPDPVETFSAILSETLVSPNFKESVFYSSSPVTGDRVPGELNLYLRRANQTVVPLTVNGEKLNGSALQYQTGVGWDRASEDFSHIFFRSVVRQLPEDPREFDNTYDWSEAGGLKLVGILPPEGSTPEAPAPEGAELAEGSLPASSEDGSEVLFKAIGRPGLFLRINGQETVEVSASQRSTPEPGPAGARAVGVTADGSEVLFTSSSELTDDASTGETAGVQNDSGADLYSYDVDSRELTDLTVDDKPQDASRGANVVFLGPPVLFPRQAGVTMLPYASKNGSSIYFVATGDLAEGAVSGELNLYVLDGGQIRFVAPATGLVSGYGTSEPTVRGFYATPDGRFAALLSSENLTAYEAGGTQQVFKYSLDSSSIECVSCRPDGVSPTAGANFSDYSPSVKTYNLRVMSDDGSRVFFTSRDAVLPGLSGEIDRVYEYAAGRPSLISPHDAKAPSTFLAASASGDDVFLGSYEELVPGADRTFAIYDARVNAEVAGPPPPECHGETCRGAGSQAAAGPPAGSTRAQVTGEVSVPHSKTAKAKALKLRVYVTEAGQLTISGNGINTSKKKVSKPGSVTLTATLTSSANKKRLDKGVFKTKAKVRFKPTAGSQSQVTGQTSVVRLTFRGPTGKGGK